MAFIGRFRLVISSLLLVSAFSARSLWFCACAVSSGVAKRRTGLKGSAFSTGVISLAAITTLPSSMPRLVSTITRSLILGSSPAVSKLYIFPACWKRTPITIAIINSGQLCLSYIQPFSPFSACPTLILRITSAG